MKHKWYNEIVAWASGAEIETKYGEHDWEVEYYPNWHSDQVEYRIKQQPKEPQYLYAYKINNVVRLVEATGYIEINHKNDHVEYIGKIKLETDND